ncbi:MAG: hypothetical protein IKD62_07940 [Oscillospiraceae bacterium]|nr:hypothetical protein [Oscillospiraceae bacterium]
MKKINDFDAIKAIKGGEPMSRVPAGGYVCRIIHAIDVPNQQYLRIELDIADGEYKGTYSDRFTKFGGNWGCVRICSYKEKALPMFKGFITAVEESNDRYKFDFNEKTLEGKLVGVLMGEEEYVTKDGEIKVNTKPQFFRSVQTIRSGDFQIPERKNVTPETIAKSSVPVINLSKPEKIDMDTLPTIDPEDVPF